MPNYYNTTQGNRSKKNAQSTQSVIDDDLSCHSEQVELMLLARAAHSRGVRLPIRANPSNLEYPAMEVLPFFASVKGVQGQEDKVVEGSPQSMTKGTKVELGRICG